MSYFVAVKEPLTVVDEPMYEKVSLSVIVMVVPSVEPVPAVEPKSSSVIAITPDESAVPEIPVFIVGLPNALPNEPAHVHCSEPLATPPARSISTSPEPPEQVSEPKPPIVTSIENEAPPT